MRRRCAAQARWRVRGLRSGAARRPRHHRLLPASRGPLCGMPWPANPRKSFGRYEARIVGCSNSNTAYIYLRSCVEWEMPTSLAGDRAGGLRWLRHGPRRPGAARHGGGVSARARVLLRFFSRVLVTASQFDSGPHERPQLLLFLPSAACLASVFRPAPSDDGSRRFARQRRGNRSSTSDSAPAAPGGARSCSSPRC